jgi:hypothetical protein
MVKKAIPGISLPQFKYGYGPELVDASDIEAPIFKSPFDLYTWRPNTPTEKEDPVDVFVVDRPRGRPLNAFFCGQHVGMKWLDEPSDVDANTRTSLTPLVLGVKDVFTAFIGETLWFVHGNEITFASFSHHAFAAQRYSELKELVTTVLEDNNCKASDTGWN